MPPMTKEQFLEKRRLDDLRRLNPTLNVQSDTYATPDFLSSIGAFEEIKRKDWGVAYELAFPERKVICYVIKEAYTEVYYYERGNTEELERRTG